MEKDISKTFKAEVNKLEKQKEKINEKIIELEEQKIRKERERRLITSLSREEHRAKGQNIKTTQNLKQQIIEWYPQTQKIFETKTISPEIIKDIQFDVIQIITGTFTPKPKNRTTETAETELGEILRALHILRENNYHLEKFIENKTCKSCMQYLTHYDFITKTLYQEEELEETKQILNNEKNIENPTNITNKDILIFIIQNNIIQNLEYQVYKQIMIGDSKITEKLLTTKNKINSAQFEG